MGSLSWKLVVSMCGADYSLVGHEAVSEKLMCHLGGRLFCAGFQPTYAHVVQSACVIVDTIRRDGVGWHVPIGQDHALGDDVEDVSPHTGVMA